MAIHVRPCEQKVIDVRPSIHVRREPMSYAKEQGWQKVGRRWEGYYRTRYGSFRGVIETPLFSGQLAYFILNPPEEILTGAHGACFREQAQNKFRIHFSYKPQDMDSGIREIEQTIQASFE